jgi:hypothetical protein
MTLAAIGGDVAIGLSHRRHRQGHGWLPTTTPLWSILLNLLVSISIGLFFGI